VNSRFDHQPEQTRAHSVQYRMDEEFSMHIYQDLLSSVCELQDDQIMSDDEDAALDMPPYQFYANVLQCSSMELDGTLDNQAPTYESPSVQEPEMVFGIPMQPTAGSARQIVAASAGRKKANRTKLGVDAQAKRRNQNKESSRRFRLKRKNSVEVAIESKYEDLLNENASLRYRVQELELPCMLSG
jgi:hypothetical protein